MTLVVSGIDETGLVVMGADTSERVDETPGESEFFKAVKFRSRPKLHKINNRVYVSIWNDTTRVDKIIRQLRLVNDCDVDEIADRLHALLEQEISEAEAENIAPDEMGFHIGGYRKCGTARIYGLGIAHEHSEREWLVYHTQLDHEPGRFRFLYNGEYALADTMVKLLADLVEHHVIEIKTTSEEFIQYLIQSTASYVLATTGLPLVGGDINSVTIAKAESAPRHLAYTRVPFQPMQFPDISTRTAGTSGEIFTATGGINHRRPKKNE